jgi:hypothetical protein
MLLLIWPLPGRCQEDGPGAALPSVLCSGSSAAATGRRQSTLRRVCRGRREGKDTEG